MQQDDLISTVKRLRQLCRVHGVTLELKEVVLGFLGHLGPEMPSYVQVH